MMIQTHALSDLIPFIQPTLIHEMMNRCWVCLFITEVHNHLTRGKWNEPPDHPPQFREGRESARFIQEGNRVPVSEATDSRNWGGPAPSAANETVPPLTS